LRIEPDYKDASTQKRLLAFRRTEAMLKLKSTRTLALVALLSTLASSAAATPVVVSFSTTGLGPLTFGGDTFSMTGASGTLGLDTVLPTSNTVNTALWNVGDSGFFSGTQNLTLSYFMTLI
jgi:hypothetical protein